jgi:SIR2-like domain/TIR domain
MNARDSQTVDARHSAEGEGAVPLNVFINYRHSDAGETGRLYDRLKQRFGAENVFMDVESMGPGHVWPEEIRSRSTSCTAFISVIGPNWLAIVKERERAKRADPKEDQVELEIVSALREKRKIFPVLMGHAQMPDALALPRSIRDLTACDAHELRAESFDRDMEALVAALEKIDTSTTEHTDATPARITRSTAANIGRSAPNQVDSTPEGPSAPPPTHEHGQAIISRDVPAPEQSHYEEVMRYMAGHGNLVPLLGSRVNGAFPDAADLAADLARRFERQQAGAPDLAEIAQYVSVTIGSSDLNSALKEALATEAEPGAIHRFLAGFPGKLRELGREQYQMILTTSYDTALEAAFKQEHEPYDLAIYMASGNDRGKFVHFDFEKSNPEPVEVPNEYVGFPMHESGELTRTLIVKIHGTVDGREGGYRWSNNYVITEDHYIDYLRGSTIESLVPFQILDKLRDSHCLFLGYSMRDWILRVFLKRIWSGERLESKSWAIEQDPDRLEKDFWKTFGVDLFATSLDDYADELSKSLAACATPT